MNRLLTCSLLALASCAGMASTDTSVVVADLATKTRSFLDSLQPAQRKVACCALEDAESQRWHFVPGRYAGVELGTLDEQQMFLVNDVLRSLLSLQGFAQTIGIVELENVLRVLESKPDKPALHRDPGRYSLLVSGEPSVDGTFVVRFQGHHVSLRAAIVDGVFASFTPHFLGSNPHQQKAASGELQDAWPLGKEEELGRAFLACLDATQLHAAVIADEAPRDVVLGPGVAVDKLGELRGVRWSELNEAQQARLWTLIEYYAHRLRGELAQQELQRIRARDLQELSFAWAGSTEKAPGNGHYYRVHGTWFAIEYDNTQNGANHVHTVWRDFERDFGGDVLRAHLEEHAGR